MPLEILVVDDIPASRSALCELVTQLGHKAIGVHSGLAALELVKGRVLDLVLLDLLMPDINGFEVTRRMREMSEGRWLPIIVISALQGEDHFIHALELGADDYLARPVNATLLQAKLSHYRRVLGLHASLEALDQRKRVILDNIRDPVITLDATGTIEELNRAALRLTDLHARPLVPGMPCESVFGLPLQQLRERHECWLRDAERGEFPAEIGLSEWQDDAQQAHFALVLRDLTERRQIERMKDEFLATVSHELRTPLTSVLGALGLLAGGAAGTLPPKAAPLADIARRNGERLSRLIDDILDLTKLEGDRMVLHLRPQRLVPLLKEALAAHQGYAVRAGVTLNTQGFADAPDPEIRLDADRFLQVMANLLSNAVKHAPAESSVTVSLTGTPRGGSRITVRDQGPGIDPRFRARMFDKFSQADGTDRRAVEGTGLGLYITRMLVERMGGHIWADEVVGPGASFSLSFLPAQAPSAP
jgi:signal transduction histidine kinase